MRACTLCGEHKEEGDFALTGYTRKRDGEKTRGRWCKICVASKTREWSKKNPRIVAKCSRVWRKENRFKHSLTSCRASAKKHGWKECIATAEEIKATFTGQCHLCGTQEEDRKLHLDHDHKTGAFRGWLCSQCNVGLGMFRDDERLLTEAIEYLTKHKAQEYLK